ncbi:hydroxymethylglutaryl- lyase [Lecanosticta acicola]|uniref:hydroxymethylglutaryl-CoA lyase n=1 Tax=Lecanosticta acicola TaxID=111012 RepID=A0AAI8Z772_9PEZI|nr:hydroxymethylglutaryl- lyase [Lecanosticta acicola]
MMATTSPTRSGVRIVEVGPRDGLQNLKSHASTEMKVELIQRLRKTGLKTIELTSIVSPRAVPQLADCRRLLSTKGIQDLQEDDELRLPVLTPNMKGLDIAMEHGVKEVAVFVSASQGFSRANINCSVGEGLSRARNICERAAMEHIAVRGYVSCIFSDPFDGPTPRQKVVSVVEELLQMGCYEVSLGDTLGVGTALDVQDLLLCLSESGINMERLAGHFHDTYGQAVANVWAAHQCGLRVFDSSIAGLGGCPYCPGAKGNVATEDLIYLFGRAGVETGVDLDEIVEVGHWITTMLDISNESRAGSALAAKRALSPPKFEYSKRVRESWSTMLPKDGSLGIEVSGTSIQILWKQLDSLWNGRYGLPRPLV